MGIGRIRISLALNEIKNLEKKHKLPVTDLVRFGDRELIDRIEDELF